MTTNTAIQRTNGTGSALSLAPPGSTWSAADIALIREKVAAGTTDAEFKLLLYMAHQYQLDPLLRQIWCVKYGDKPAQIFAGRDGFLAIAHRGERFDGLQCTVRVEPTPLLVTYWDGKARAEKTFTRDTQYVATATAWRKGAAHPVIVEVWEEEYSTGRDLWISKPRTMITKVAECQALRKAFNISGLYDPDEIRDAPPALVPSNVNPQTGEIAGESREVFDDEPDPDAEYRNTLQQRFTRAAALAGRDSGKVIASIVKKHNTSWNTLPVDTLIKACEYYEAEAALVQGEGVTT